MDIKRAFETINRDLLINKLKGYGIAGIVFEWLIDYLDNRKQVVKYNEITSSEKLVE